MSSLEGCIKKAGKALRKSDADAIRKIRDDILLNDKHGGDGLSANQMAVNEYLDILDLERQTIMEQAEKRGGVLADKKLSPSEFTKQASQRMEDRARDFAQVGLRRDRDKSNNIDMMLMPLKDLHEVLEHFDPEMAATMLKENGGKLEGTLADNEELFETYMGHIQPHLKKMKRVPLKFASGKIDPKLKKFVDKHPDSPTAQVVKLGGMAEGVSEEAELSPKRIQRLLERLTKTVGGKNPEISKSLVLDLFPQNKLPDIIRSRDMESSKNYVKRIKEMSTFMEQLMESHADLAVVWGQFVKDNPKAGKLLGELMASTTLTGVEIHNFQPPTAAEYKKMNKTKRAMWDDRQEDYDILKPFWDKLGKAGKQVEYTKRVYLQAKENPDGTRDAGKMGTADPIKMSEGQAIFNRVRDTYENQRIRGIEGLMNRVAETEADLALRQAKIAQLRQLFESGKINPYFPLTRFGKYAVVAKDPETHEVVALFKRENREERNRLKEALQARGFRAYAIDDVSSDAALVNQIDPNFVKKITEIVGEKMDGDESFAVQDEIWQMYLKSLPEMSVRKAFIHREGRLGFTHDALRAFADNTFHGTHQLAKLKFGYQLQKHLELAKSEAKLLTAKVDLITDAEAGRMPEGYNDFELHDWMFATDPDYRLAYEAAMLKNPDDEGAGDRIRAKIKKEAEHDGPWATPLYDQLAQRHVYNMNPNSGVLATKLTGLGFLWFLSSSPAAGVLNLTQTAISAYPILRAEFAGAGAGRELLAASLQYSTSGEVHAGTFGGKLRNDKLKNGKDSEEHGEKAAMHEFAISGMYAKTRTRDLMGTAEHGINKNDKWFKGIEMAGYIFHKTEEANRMVTSLAAYRLARKKFANEKHSDGQPWGEQRKHDEAVILADRLTYDAHYDYTNTNRPPIMQGDAGRVVFLFRNFSVNMTYRLVRDFRDGVWKNEHISKAERKKAKSRFVGMITMTSMFAGISGWPLISATHAIVDMMLDNFDDDEEFHDSRTEFRAWMTEAWGPEISEAIYKGPWDAWMHEIAPVGSLSARASLNNLWLREVPESLEGRDLLLHYMGEAGGPIAGLALNMAQGAHDMANDQTWRGVEKFMPKAAADALKALRYYQKGAQTRQLDLILPPEEFSGFDLAAQAVGFVPSELVKQYEQNRAIMDMNTKLTRRHGQLMNRLFNAYKMGDRKGIKEANRDIVKWNVLHPQWPIKPSTIRQSAKQRAAYDMRTVGGIALDKRMSYLHEQMRFTAKRKKK